MVATFYPQYCCLYPIKSRIKPILHGFNPWFSCLQSLFSSLNLHVRGLYPNELLPYIYHKPYGDIGMLSTTTLYPHQRYPMFKPNRTFRWIQDRPNHSSHRWGGKMPQPQCGLPSSQIWLMTPMTTILSIIKHTYYLIGALNRSKYHKPYLFDF